MSLAGTTEDQHALIEARLSKVYKAQPDQLNALLECFDCSIRMIVLLVYINLQSSECGLLVGKWPMGNH